MNTFDIGKMAPKFVGKWYCDSGSYAPFSSSIAALNDSTTGSIDYHSYVPNSQQWKQRLEIYKQYYGNECQIHRHKIQSGLCLHHRHYNTVGREGLNDVVLICKSCHNRLHDEEKRAKQYNECRSRAEQINKTIWDRIQNQ